MAPFTNGKYILTAFIFLCSLKIAKRYNILILEDDAYAFLYYGPAGQQARSYFALEGEVNGDVGRVVRYVASLRYSVSLNISSGSTHLARC
jgi:tryptophan aminotransferase